MSSTLPVTGNTAYTAPENRAFFPALDGLRTFAFLLVFFSHYASLPWGWGGVNFFFVLSGFLITGILFDTREDPHRARNFYVRRTLRIFPLYYAVLVALLLASPVVHWVMSWRWIFWALYLGNFLHFGPVSPGSLAQRLGDFQPSGVFHGHPFTLFLGHFWSLCIEEQFYLIWPWLVFAIKDRRKLLWLCGCSLPVGLCLRLVAKDLLPPWMIGQNVLSRFTPFSCDALLFGGFLALLLRGPQRMRLLMLARWALVPFLLVCAWWLRFHATHNQPGSYAYPVWTETLGFTVLDLLGALLLLNALHPGDVVYSVFNLRPLRWAGRLSYGAYVFHDIPHLFFQRISLYGHPHERITMLLSSLVFTYVAAWLSFRFLESPFLDLKERWTIRSKPMTSPQSSLAPATLPLTG